MVKKKSEFPSGVRSENGWPVIEKVKRRRLPPPTQAIVRQVTKSRRAQLIRDRQRFALIKVMVESMVEFDISIDDLAEAHKTFVLDIQSEKRQSDSQALEKELTLILGHHGHVMKQP